MKGSLNTLYLKYKQKYNFHYKNEKINLIFY